MVAITDRIRLLVGVINITKEFTGNLQKGKAELDSEREKQREENAKELNEKIQTDIWTSPKF